MNDEELKDLLRQAIEKTYSEEPTLFDKEGIEQAMVFRIGIHLQELLKETEISNLNLDCEYNKNLKKTKITPNYPKGIRPDILIHERGSHSSNKLAIEFKGWWNPKHDNDIQKLKDLTQKGGGYEYKLGVFVRLGKEKAEYTYFKNGREEKTNE